MPKDKLDQALESALAQGGGEEEELPQQEAEPGVEAEPEAPVAEQPEEVEQEQPGESEDAPPQPRAKAQEPAAPQLGKKPGAKGPAKPPAAESPAPRTWAPVVREHWTALPRQVKDQILKREGEISRVVQESAEARKGYERFQQTLQPFLPHLQATGVEPTQAISNLFRTEYTLRAGTPAQKAELVANLIDSYQVDVGALAARLEGKPAPQAVQQVPPFRDPRLDQLLGHLQQTQQQQAATARAQAAQTIQEFAQEAEFLDEVATDMSHLMRVAREGGKPLTLKQAYDKACLMNDDVRTVLEKRKASEAARTLSQKAQQARYAAGSVKSEPASPGGGRKPTLEEALWAGLNGR